LLQEGRLLGSHLQGIIAWLNDQPFKKLMMGTGCTDSPEYALKQ
jgi:hypothetical protein